MSQSDVQSRFADLASELAALCAQAADSQNLSDIPDDSLGQIIGSAVRVYAAKAQMGQAQRPYGRNSGVTVTDVAITCSALLDGVGLEVFELGAWQSMSGIGRLNNIRQD